MDRKLKIISIVIAATAAFISFLILIFGEGIIWRGQSSNLDSLSTNAPTIENRENNSTTPILPETVSPTTDTPITPSTTSPSNSNFDDNNPVPNSTQASIPETTSPTADSGATAQPTTSPSNNNFDANNPLSNNIHESIITGIQTNTTSSGLSLIVEDCEYFYDGFYHQIPESATSYSFVEFDKGISGHFSYSRELTIAEYEDWGHGGKILDASGNQYEPDGSFYATIDGVFAMEFPEGISKGNYTYLLYLYVAGEYCEARIPFSIG